MDNYINIDSIIVLFDDRTRIMMRSNLADFNRTNIIFINNLTEITADLVRVSDKVVIFESFLGEANALSKIKLYKELYKINFIYLGADSYWFEEISDIAYVYPCDYKNISYDILQAAISHDKSLTGETKEEFFEKENDLINHLSTSTDAKLLEFVSYYKAMKKSRNYYQKKSYVLERNLNNIQRLNSALAARNSKLESGYADIIKDSYRLNETLSEYEVILTQNVYTKVNLNDYNNKPIIIYFKEYEELLDMDIFISTLAEVIRLQHHKTVKVVHLYDSDSVRNIKTLPSYYKILRNRFMLKDVYNSDFIAKSGDYIKLFDLILTNRVNLEILIVVDCKTIDDDVFLGSYLPFNICREKTHLNVFNLKESNTITNSSDSKSTLGFSINRDEIFAMENEPRFLKLSNLPVFHNILNILELYENSL